ncbi:hypothetical protein ACKKBG_A17350 [Auxenochlorella protothecoides x Auxenochlorella symbiontica]|uniref:dCMP deaminase n=2 Tax=Auxenochlorella protothecoides TaxID=3075 RepID=A0A1D2ABC6_AUXPR
MHTYSHRSDLALVGAAVGAAVVSSSLTYWFLRSQCTRQWRQRCVHFVGCGPDAKRDSMLDSAGPCPVNPYDTKPRSGYLSWDDYFMAVAFLSSQRSKDPHKQVGACIVDRQNVICGIGYNGFPRGCPDAQLPWSKAAESGDLLDTKYPYVCHAEMNALLNKNGASVSGARIYVTMFPCNECAKLMIQAGIAEVVFHEDKGTAAGGSSPAAGSAQPAPGSISRSQQYAASKKLMAMAGVHVRQHRFHRSVRLCLDPDPA